MLTDAAFITKVRDRLADNETTLMFDDTELKRHITQAVTDYSWYRSAFKSSDITILADTTNYQLPSDCISVRAVYDPDDNLFTAWEQDGNYLVVASTLSETLATLTIKYDGTHEASNGSYPTILDLNEGDLVDLMEARCLDILAVDMNKRPAFTEAQAKIDHQSAAVQWARRAAALRMKVAMKYERFFSAIG